MTIKQIDCINKNGEIKFSYDYYLETEAHCTCGTTFEMNPDRLAKTRCPHCGKYYMWYGDDIIANDDYCDSFHYDEDEIEF